MNASPAIPLINLTIDTPLKPGGADRVGLVEWWKESADPWRDSMLATVTRRDYRRDGEILEGGVNFFVLMLEHLGARPRFSCEGHPSGFYVAFYAEHDLARAVADAGYFRVEVGSRERDCWVIRLAEINPDGSGWVERSKERVLSAAAKAWVDRFLRPSPDGPVFNPRSLYPLPEVTANAETLTSILLKTLVNYQPHTNCRKVVEGIIEEFHEAGLIETLSPFSAADPGHFKVSP